MTKRQLTILIALGIAVLCILSLGGYIVIFEERTYQALRVPETQPTATWMPTKTLTSLPTWPPTAKAVFPKIIYKLVVGHKKEFYRDYMSVDVTMTTTGSNTEQFITHNFPKTDPSRLDEKYREIEFEANRGQFLYISLQESDGHYGWIRCEIYCDGKLVDSAASSGPFSIASCSGSAD